MKNLKSQKGITLVALVITIIVLLILAGVSLSLVAGSNGILGKAQSAVSKTASANAKEEVEMKLSEYIADWYEAKYVNGNTNLDVNAYIASRAGTSAHNESNGTWTCNSAGTTITLNVVKSDTQFIGTITSAGALSWDAGTTPIPASNP